MANGAAPRKTKGTINLQVDDETRDLIDRAANASGRTRTDFMIQSSRAEAQHVLLNQVIFPLDNDAWDELQAVLADPPPPNETLKAAFRKRPLWEW